jgi:dephospho-CoA kinase
MKAKTLKVGVTGGIGSGKSSALSATRRWGAAVVDADEIAREQARPGGEAFRRIVKAFGKSILDEEKAIDRKKLGAIVFKDAAKRRKLERITHPLVLKELSRRLKAAKGVAYAAVPLLFESGAESLFDLTMTIEAPAAARRRRVARRDALSEAQVGERIAAQMTEKERASRADVVIRNDGSKMNFLKKVREYHRALSLLRHGAETARAAATA